MTEEEVFFLETDVVHLLVVGVMLFTFTQTIGQISNTFDFVNLQIVVQCRIGNSSSSFYWKVEGGLGCSYILKIGFELMPARTACPTITRSPKKNFRHISQYLTDCTTVLCWGPC